MALIPVPLYDALQAAGAPQRIEHDLALLKWMIGGVIALQLGLFWMQWQTLDQPAAIEARIANLETSLTRVEEQLSDTQSGLTRAEDPLSEPKASPRMRFREA